MRIRKLELFLVLPETTNYKAKYKLRTKLLLRLVIILIKCEISNWLTFVHAAVVWCEV